MLRVLICGLMCWCVMGCSEDGEGDDVTDDCAPGLACDPDGQGADYCPWGECNWCSCDEDGEWQCTASAACDAEVEPDVGEPDASMPADGQVCDADASCEPEADMGGA